MITAGGCVLALTDCQPGSNTSSSLPMNVIFILADDLGWSDCTLYGTTNLYETPNLERLAARGLTFTRAYSASPLCSPTRASILTGQTPARNGHTGPSHHTGNVKLTASIGESSGPGNKAVICQSASRLDTIIPTLGKLIKAEGYATAHFGKWHLGHPPYTPLEHGFDIDIPHFAGPGPYGGFLAPWEFTDLQENYPGEHIEDRMAEEAVNWMRSLDSDQTFYMHYWQFSVHAPFDAKDELMEYYRPRIDTTQVQRSYTYAAMVHSLDDAIGTLLDEIDRLGIADRTAIIFISDNGGNMYNGIVETTMSGAEYVTAPTSNAPLRGGKATIFEGGIRVPGIVVWPGITTAGTITDAMIQTTDFYPTILNLLGISLPEDHVIDGVDITPALLGQSWQREPMFTYFPHSPGVPDWLPPSVAVHSDHWKLIRLFHQGKNQKHDYLLYNLKDDIGEQNNLADRYPRRVREMDALIQAHLDDGNSVVPIPNPNFDPEQYRPERIGVQQGGLRVENPAR